MALDNLKQAHTTTSEPAQIVIDAGHRYCCSFLSRGSDQVDNIGLQAGENYLLRFAHTSQRIKCKFSGPRAETPEPFSVSSEQNDLVDVNCIGGPVKIRVVQDVPIPRFQVSFQFSSPICNMSGSPPFALKLSIRSLEPRPVTVDMGFSPWKSFEGLRKLIKLTDTATENEVELPYVSFCCDGQLTSTPNDFMEFNEGTEYIREWGFYKGPPGTMSEMDCLQPNRTYVAELVDIGFCCWQYGAKAEVLGIMNDRFQVGGPIQPEIVEAAPTIANIIENIFERDRAGPFVRLPRELRDQVYGNFKSSNPSRQFFRTEAGAGTPA